MTISRYVAALLLCCLIHTAFAPLGTQASPSNPQSKRQTLEPSYEGKSRDGDDHCHVQSAAKYIQAVISHHLGDARAIPTTENVKRDEGPPGLLVRTASNRRELIASSVAGPQAIFGGPLHDGKEPSYDIINSTAVLSTYTIDAGLLAGSVPLTTAKIEETFVFPQPSDCRISYIQAIIHAGQS